MEDVERRPKRASSTLLDMAKFLLTVRKQGAHAILRFAEEIRWTSYQPAKPKITGSSALQEMILLAS